MRFKIIGFLAGTFLFVNANVWAEKEQGEVGWGPSSAGPITAWTAPLVGKGKLALQPFMVYSRTRGTFDDDGDYASLPKGERKSQFQQQIFSQYGLTDKWEIDAQMVYLENYVTTEGNKSHSQGLGDSLIFTRYQLLEETASLAEISGLLQLKIPTGKYQHLDEEKNEADAMGTGSWDLGVGLNFTKKFQPFLVHADAIASFPREVSVDGVETQYGNYLNYDLAVEYFLPKGFNLMLEANGLYQGYTKLDGEESAASDVHSLTLSPGIGWSNDRIQTLIAYQRTVAAKNSDANDAVVATFVYTF